MAKLYANSHPGFDFDRYDKLTELFGLDPAKNLSTFSKGMKKQVSILLGLCSGTKYLLCDETFDGLDPVVRQAVKSLFAAEILNRDFTPIISSHNLRELEDFCDSIGLLHQGQLLLTQSLDQIKCSVCKLQCVISDPHKEQQFLSSIKILKMERSGSLLTLTLRGSHSDILSAVQTYDPVFAETIAYQFGKVDAYFNKKTNLSKEEIIELGKKTSFYKPYLKNTLTDGQGYRIFSSYRNVMGMAGK